MLLSPLTVSCAGKVISWLDKTDARLFSFSLSSRLPSRQDEILRRAVQCYKGKNWRKIAEFFPDRTDVQCLHRWQKVLNPDLVKGPWTKE
ncbi:unnamed protein product, partial [Closterium sp. NIES-54]